MNQEKIIHDHKRKSKQLKELKKIQKRDAQNKIPVKRLEALLLREKRSSISGMDYEGQYGFDNEGYERAETSREARIELLESLIHSAKTGNDNTNWY